MLIKKTGTELLNYTAGENFKLAGHYSATFNWGHEGDFASLFFSVTILMMEQIPGYQLTKSFRGSVFMQSGWIAQSQQDETQQK